MSRDELLDLVNEDDEVIGTVWKSEAHGDPSKIHREVDITVFSPDGKVLLQQRAMTKSSPGEWKNTATGHVAAGEDPNDAIKRELFEELGIRADPIFIKKMFAKERDESRFYWIYYAVIDNKIQLKFDKDEVMKAEWIKINALEVFSEHNEINESEIKHVREVYKVSQKNQNKYE